MCVRPSHCSTRTSRSTRSSMRAGNRRSADITMEATGMAPMHEPNRSTKPRSNDRGRLAVRRGHALSVAAGVFLAMSPAGAANWDFTPRVALGQTWTDNVSLAADGFEESEWITEFTPGFLLEVEGQRVDAEVNYDLQSLWYADNSDFNETYHQLDGVGEFVLWPES